MKNFILAALLFGGFSFVLLSLLGINIPNAVMLGLGAGLLFAALITIATHLLQSSLLKNGPQDYLLSEPANFFTGTVAVGGRIYLLSNQLEFHAHPLNLNKETVIIPYTQISTIENKGSGEKLTLVLKSGEQRTFLVSSKMEFVNALNAFCL